MNINISSPKWFRKGRGRVENTGTEDEPLFEVLVMRRVFHRKGWEETMEEFYISFLRKSDAEQFASSLAKGTGVLVTSKEPY
jgi:hypothetical protein